MNKRKPSLICHLPVLAIAQVMSEGGATGLDNTNPYNVLKRDWVAAGKVAALRGDPAAGARVEVVPTSVSGGFLTLATNL
jgi:hypothetical protein